MINRYFIQIKNLYWSRYKTNPILFGFDKKLSHTHSKTIFPTNTKNTNTSNKINSITINNTNNTNNTFCSSDKSNNPNKNTIQLKLEQGNNTMDCKDKKICNKVCSKK